jgi:SAM-dependent methyltransferase
LDLGCGTARFLEQAMMRLPNASAVAVDNSQEMLDVAAAKPGFNGRRVQFIQRDLTSGLPQDLGAFDLVCSFSAVHHLSDEHKARLFRQVREVLRPGGWFFLIDPMIETFDKDVFSTGRNREIRLRAERIARSRIDEETIRHLEHVKKSLGTDSPEKDRFGSLDDYVKWMHEAGFKSVDHIWHFWMEHFFICRS